MDTSLLISLLLGLPVAVLAMLQILDRWKKHRASNHKAPAEGQVLSSEPTIYQIAPLLCQAELIAEIEMQMGEGLHHSEAEQHET